jgi:transcriptional regulator with XRE-family HTH domain
MAKDEKKERESDTLLRSLRKLTGQVAGGTLDLARNTAAMTSMFGEGWLRNNLLNQFDPARLEAMAEAGHFLRDARETAGLSIKDLAENLGLKDKSVLEDIESGQTIMPLELMLRSASLVARHDPIPFLIKFMRTYNPALEKTLEQWGVMALPKQYERERRFVNIYRQHDILRALSDAEHARFIRYMESSCNLVLDVMLKEKEANLSGRPQPAEAEAEAEDDDSPRTGRKQIAPRKHKRAPSAKRKKS